MKKIIGALVLIIIIIGYFLIVTLPKNYKTNYVINDYSITEEYFKDKEIIDFKIIKKDVSFSISYEIIYPKKRQIITEIKEYEKDNTICIYPIIEHQSTFPLCTIDKQLVHFSLIEDEEFREFINKNYPIKNNEIEKEYQKINIFNYDNSSYIIWNYHQLLYLSDKKNKKINLFENEIVDTSLMVQTDKYLLTPDYDQRYSFNTFYIIDLEKFEKINWKIDFEISYNSYILGINNNKIYLVDRKNKKEYEININKKKIIEITPQIFDNGWQDISINKLVKEDYTFNNKLAFNYIYLDDKLMLNTYSNLKILLLEKKDLKIISIYKNKIYYLVDDELFVFDLYYGEKKLLSYFEWNFNYDNKIFFYNK